MPFKCLIEDKHLFKQAVRHYRSQGFEIAIDDVGSGYSNLNRINHTQPEYIKLDKELIQDIHLNKDKHTMGEVMVNYCKAMHYKLIVEGIETKEELECLIQLGIEYGQGYYLKNAEFLSVSCLVLVEIIRSLNLTQSLLVSGHIKLFFKFSLLSL